MKENRGDSKNRYRLSVHTAKKLGLKVNSSGRYRLSNDQKEELFNMDMQPIRRLFFDIETSPYKGYFWSQYSKYIPHDMVEEPMKVICISYKWEGENKIHRLVWNKGDDKKMVEQFIKIMNTANEIIAHNGDRYDIRVLRTRAIYHRIPMMPKYRTLDTLKKAKSGFKFFSNKLDNIAKELGVGAKIEHSGWSMWERTMKGDKDALEEMGNYCDGDIVVLEDVFFTLQNYVLNNTHVGTLNGGLKCSCPNCGSEDINLVQNVFTAKGTIKRLMDCNTCGYSYETSNAAYRTFLELRKSPISAN